MNDVLPRLTKFVAIFMIKIIRMFLNLWLRRISKPSSNLAKPSSNYLELPRKKLT
jgi:hypothetical protein